MALVFGNLIKISNNYSNLKSQKNLLWLAGKVESMPLLSTSEIQEDRWTHDKIVKADYEVSIFPRDNNNTRQDKKKEETT